jgi:serine/threonine protein kinase
VCYSCSAASPLPSYDYYSRQPNARLDETQARFIIAECVLSLEYIHRCIAPRDCAVSFWFHLFARSKGYVHRDIKPENVLLTADGHCKMVGPFSFVLACVCLCVCVPVCSRVKRRQISACPHQTRIAARPKRGRDSCRCRRYGVCSLDRDVDA